MFFGVWNLQFRIAYGLVYASDLTGEVPAAQIPRFDGSEKDDLIIGLWENGFGNIREKLSEYNDREVKLNSIFLVYGSYDHYRWIPNGCRYIETQFKQFDIDYESHEFKGGHDFYYDEYLSFFSRNLAAE